MKRLLPLLLVLSCAGTASAQLPGIDSTFGRFGAAWRNVFHSDDHALAIALRPDGKTLVAGTVTVDSVPQMGILQFLPDGQLDPDFHWNGKGALANYDSPSAAHAVSLDMQGRAVIAGYLTSPNEDEQFSLVRLMPDGSFDPSFGVDGRINTGFSPLSRDQANAVLIQPDGKIVAAGFTRTNKDADFAMARYLSNGNLDPEFGNNGLVVTKMDTLADIIRDIALQANGKIVICGTSVDPLGFNAPAYFALGRYLPNGTLDPLFAGNGRVRIDISGDEDSDIAKTLALTSTGQIVVAGYSANDLIVTRFMSNGLLDNTFGTNGVTQVQLFTNSANFGNDLLLLPDNSIVVGGMAENVDFKDAFLIKLKSDGKLDPAFGQGGKVIRSLSTKDDNAYGLALRPDGRILLAGDTRQDGAFYTDAVVMQFMPDGTADATFGQAGAVIEDVGTSEDTGFDVSISTDGAVLATGSSSDAFQSGAGVGIVAKWNKQGVPDSTFAQNGILQVGLLKEFNRFLGIVHQADDKVVLMGGIGGRVRLYRYTPSGVLDPTFGTNGQTSLPLSLGSEGYSLIEHPDGSLFIAGGNGAKGFVYKLTPDGKPDLTFGSNGQADADADFDLWTDVAVQTNGNIVVGGTTLNGVDDITVTRLLPNGQRDPSFGQGGTVRYAKVVYPYALQTQSDDKILLTGFFSVMRLLPSGDLDPSFGNNGLASLEGENTPELTDVQVQRDGKIILAGKFIEVNPTPASLNAVVARLQPDGSRDKTWGNDGILRLRGKAAFHTTFDAQGNTLAVGHIDNGERTDIVVYRILRGEYVGTADRPDADQTLLNVFPNPVSEEVSVAYDLLSEQEVNIRLYDSGGRQVHTLLAGTTRQAGQHTEHLTLPPGLTAGLYTLSILTSKGQVAVQIVVQP